LILELSDDLIEDGVLLISLGFVFSVDFSLVFEITDGLLEGVVRFLDDGSGLDLLGDGGSNLGGGSVGVELLSLVFLFELVDFSFGGGQPSSELPGSVDFVFLEVLNGFLNSGFKILEDLKELFREGTVSLSWGTLHLFFGFTA
jgi:hypothetical protein